MQGSHPIEEPEDLKIPPSLLLFLTPSQRITLEAHVAANPDSGRLHMAAIEKVRRVMLCDILR
jgi:hypothetical protein